MGYLGCAGRGWYECPGKHSTNSSIWAPPARFSEGVFTGTRVPLSAQEPLILPDLRSTAGHDFQSVPLVDYLVVKPVPQRRMGIVSSAAAPRTSSFPVTTSAIRRSRYSSRRATSSYVRSMYRTVTSDARSTNFNDGALFFGRRAKKPDAQEILRIQPQSGGANASRPANVLVLVCRGA